MNGILSLEYENTFEINWLFRKVFRKLQKSVGYWQMWVFVASFYKNILVQRALDSYKVRFDLLLAVALFCLLVFTSNRLFEKPTKSQYLHAHAQPILYFMYVIRMQVCSHRFYEVSIARFWIYHE